MGSIFPSLDKVPPLPDGDEGGALAHGAVAVDAGDGCDGAWLDVEQSVAVGIIVEVTVHALHAAGEVDVFEVHGLFEFVGVVVRDFLVLKGEQIAFAVFFEHGAEDPAVTVVVGKLRLLEFGVQLGTFSRKLISPQSPRAAAASGFFLSDWAFRRRWDFFVPWDT
jgi:hypothetical protein